MTMEQWLLTGVSISWGGWMLSLAVGKWIQKQETSDQMPRYRLDLLEKRMDLAGEKASDLADHVQALPERMRGEFFTRREWDAIESFERRKNPR